ncbi:MAG: GGGtGRT protein [Oscillospiraceae bacterium]|nr:GGGtGRT protein [Oscillospiraceae bacterium]
MPETLEFEKKEKRSTQKLTYIKKILSENNIKDFDEIFELCKTKNINPKKIVKSVQPICFDDAVLAFALGAAIAIKKNVKTAEEAAKFIGIGLQAFCISGSVADQRKVGIGHGNLASMLLNEETQCFAFLAGHESFAAAEGAICIADSANKARKAPLKVVLNGLGKSAAYIISRINGFTYVETQFEHASCILKITDQIRFSDSNRSLIRCYGCDDAEEGLAVMKLEEVDVSITGNSTNPVRFQHLVAGAYKKFTQNTKKKYFSVASGGGTGRTLHPDNVAAGPASYGLTDSMGRMHADAQFAGSSSVPAHVKMMGFIGMGNNPIVGATVALAVAVSS